MVGKIVMTAAAKHMTPVTLECGGKNPVYVDESADMQVTARRLVWGRFANNGQTCVAPDYVLCTKRTQVTPTWDLTHLSVHSTGTSSNESRPLFLLAFSSKRKNL